MTNQTIESNNEFKEKLYSLVMQQAQESKLNGKSEFNIQFSLEKKGSDGTDIQEFGMLVCFELGGVGLCVPV